MRIADVKFATSPEDINSFVTNSFRPAYWSKDGKTAYDHRGKVVSNALLSRDQWEKIDSAVISRTRLRLNAWQDVLSAGLTTSTTLAEWSTKWKVASERKKAEVNMDFESGRDQDRTDRKHYSVPIPIISTGFSFGRREILTAQANGTDLELFEAEEAAEAVSERAEEILVDGETGVVVEGQSIPGLRTLSARLSDTASGDFGTLSNVYTSFTKFVRLSAANRFYGPFSFYLHRTQYIEMLDYYSDGSDVTGLDRVLRIPEVASVKINDLMTAGEFVGVMHDSKVLDIRIALPLQTRRWESPSGDRVHYKVLYAAVPRLKTDYAGNSGIGHFTGA